VQVSSSSNDAKLLGMGACDDEVRRDAMNLMMPMAAPIACWCVARV
jgi:hypothetical protein